MVAGRRSRRSLLVLVACTSALIGSVAVPAQAAPEDPSVTVEDGVTQPEFSYDDAVREHIMVQTPVDTDGNGESDRVGIDIIRPQATEGDLQVPVIIDASPYYDNLGRGNESERKRYDDDGDPVKFPLFYDNYFVPRGYAVVQVDMVGTNNSEGCPVTGGSGEVRAAKAVIDWLNGRGTAYDSDGERTEAYWTGGKTAMIGKSYDGTLANGVAATGVEGLETIVPIAAISSWYDYYRYGGAIYFPGGPPGLARVVDTDPSEKCADVRQDLDEGADDASGDYNAFWDDRNYRDGTVTEVDNVDASVFAVHSLNDLNVEADHFSRWWEGLSRNGVPRKLWLSTTGHVDPFDFRRDEWIATLHRWFDHWLHGIRNGIMDEPRVDLQTGPHQWETQQAWPAERAKDVRLWLGPEEGKRPGTLTRRPAPARQTQRFTDDPNQNEREMVAEQFAAKPHRLMYLSERLQRPVRMSGTPVMELVARINQSNTNLTALVVDYGTAERVNHLGPGEGIVTLDEEGCYGKSTESDDACYHRTRIDTEKAPVEIVARGWLDAQNRTSLREERPLEPGKRYRMDWDLLPHDYVFDAGHRIGVVVAANDASFLHAPDEDARGAGVTVSLGRSHISLPLVGGRQALSWSPAEARPTPPGLQESSVPWPVPSKERLRDRP